MASHQVDWRKTFPSQCQGGALAIGNFDGAHAGHAVLVEELRRAAQAVGGPSVVMTFDPHPMALLRPERAPILLTTPEDRGEQLEKMGVNEVLTVRVTPELLDLRAEEFFEQVLRSRLDVKAMVEGQNFRFGHNREGDVVLLRRLCESVGVPLTIVSPVLIEGREVSSTRIRMALASGDVSLAARLLGRTYRLRGVVGHGVRRGRTIGFPTANLQRVNTVIPAPGVYACMAQVGEKRWAAAVNIGGNPTFAEVEPKIEAHLLDFADDVYGLDLSIDFVQRLRDTRPFGCVNELVEQLRKDVDETRRVTQSTE